MSRHLKVLTALMMWVVITAGIAATTADPAAASLESTARQRVDVATLRTSAALRSSPNLGGFSLTGMLAPGATTEEDAIEAAEGTKGFHEEFGEDAMRPAPRISPPVGAQQIVGLYTWLAIDPEAWKEIEIDDREDDAGYKYIAVPIRTIWTFSDQVITCDGPGTPYTEGAAGPPPCGRTWTHTSEVAPMTMDVAIEYEVSWAEYEEECTDIDESESCDSEKVDGQEGTYIQKGDSLETYELRIGEIHSIGTARDVDNIAGGPDYRAEQDSIESEQGYNECGDFQVICDFADDVGDEIIETLTGVVGFVIRTLMQGISWLRSILPDELKIVLDFIEGCADQFDDILQGILSSISDILAGPVAYFTNLFSDLILLIQALSSDPVTFATEFLREELELDEAEENLASWAGGWACEFALDAVTGGSQFAVRLQDWLDGLPDVPDSPATPPQRDHDSGDPDSDPDSGDGNDADTDDRDDNDDRDDELTDSCEANSFPTGTLVLMADGSHRPIEAIGPGDRVVSADETTGRWSTNVVLDQWSHPDDGVIATVTLVDGSTVSATDQHLFWVSSDEAWIELEDVRPGDHLLSPDGVTIVADVELSPPQETLVWELDVAVDDTFTVHTGTADVLVHNAPCVIAGGEGETIVGDPRLRHIGDGPRTQPAANLDSRGRQRTEVENRRGQFVKTKEPSAANANFHEEFVTHADGSRTYTFSQESGLGGKTITYRDGFPVFAEEDTAIDLHFDEDHLVPNVNGNAVQLSQGRREDFLQANAQTAEHYANDQTAFDHLDEPHRTNMRNFYAEDGGWETNEKPPGYTWHHHQDVGRMQLVEENVHAATPHHGGEAIWGEI